MPPKIQESLGSSAADGSKSDLESEFQDFNAIEAAFAKFCLKIEKRFTELESKIESKFEAKSLSDFESLRSPTLEHDLRSDHRPNRQSLGTVRSLDSQDVVVRNIKSSFRLDKPKFESPSDVKNDGAFDESVLKFIEECDRHIEIWLHLPENKDKHFEGSEVFALVSLPASVQKRVAHNLDMIYDKSEIVGWSLQQIQRAVYWNRATTEMVKRAILVRKAQGVARKDSVKSIQPPAIAWPHGVGLIHLDAFEEYKSKLTTQISRLADGGVSLPFIAIKDAIISAIPDRDFKIELYAQYGHSGSLPGPDASGASQEFSMKDIFDFIRAYIVVIKQKGLAQAVNKFSTLSSPTTFTPPTARKFMGKSAFSKVHTIDARSEFPESDHSFWESRQSRDDSRQSHVQHPAEHVSDDDDYISVNAIAREAASKDCRHAGTGPDGKLLCPWLGNPETAKCGFRHSAKELELKGKGVSKSTPAQPKKVHHASVGLGIQYAADSEPIENGEDLDS
jgi:hypothetical protein